MGIYLNPGNELFEFAINSEIYVDKSMLITQTNKVLDTEQLYVAVSRPRRFGKSMAANMLVAYYDKSCDSHDLFDTLAISKTESYEKFLNKYNVIKLNMQDFFSEAVEAEQEIFFPNKYVRDCKARNDFKLLKAEKPFQGTFLNNIIQADWRNEDVRV